MIRFEFLVWDFENGCEVRRRGYVNPDHIVSVVETKNAGQAILTVSSLDGGDSGSLRYNLVESVDNFAKRAIRQEPGAEPPPESPGLTDWSKVPYGGGQ